MSTVAEIAVSYAAKGARGAVRADRQVRDSINTTAKTAQSEAGTIDRWMERHKSAIQGIGLATAATMGAIISASPTMRAELSGVRMAFSLFADTVINDVLPSGASLMDLAFDLQEAYANLPDPIRNVTSWLFILGGLIAGLALTFAGASTIISGTFVATALAGVISAGATAASVLAGIVTSATALAIGLGVAAGVVGVWVLEALGFMDVVRDLGTLVGDRLPEWITDGMILVTSAFLGPLLFIGAAINGFIDDGIHGMIREVREMGRIIESAFWSTADRIRDVLRDLGVWIVDFFTGLATDASDWGREIGSNFADTFRSAWNDAVPSSVSIPSITIAGRTYGGGSISLPRLRHGGMIESGGLAQLHAGERVVPAADVSSDSGGMRGGSVVLNIEQYIDSGGSPRRTGDKSADAVSREIQNEFGARR